MRACRAGRKILVVRSKFLPEDEAGRKKPGPLEAVLAERPDLKGRPYHSPEEGSSADVIVFNDDGEVFKVRKSGTAAGLKQEIGILKHLEDRDLPAPRLTTVTSDGSMFGMTKTSGVCLSPERLAAMTQNEQQAIARDIADFIYKMAQGFTHKDAADLGIDRQKARDAWGACANPSATAEALHHPRMQENLGRNKNTINGLVQGYMGTLPDRKRVVMHMDLNSGNIFIDPDTKKMTGVIDFGEVGYVPPEQGFINMAKTYPKPFIERVCGEYSRLSGQDVTYKNIAVAGLARDIEPAARIYAGKQGGTQAVTYLHKYVNIWVDKLEISPPRVKKHNIYKP